MRLSGPIDVLVVSHLPEEGPFGSTRRPRWRRLRLGDGGGPGGVGLGLAVAHGFLTAMDATLEIDDTPGGGTTMVIAIPVAP